MKADSISTLGCRSLIFLGLWQLSANDMNLWCHSSLIHIGVLQRLLILASLQRCGFGAVIVGSQHKCCGICWFLYAVAWFPKGATLFYALISCFLVCVGLMISKDCRVDGRRTLFLHAISVLNLL
ncbi:unnamed protein product [Ilex paraguariensis]|uniref:Uncharacterized protein n=1 Tax=Ilex paraguariensis TaxID=185542 RepID=A0ABC8QW45_9AQUA